VQCKLSLRNVAHGVDAWFQPALVLAMPTNSYYLEQMKMASWLQLHKFPIIRQRNELYVTK